MSKETINASEQESVFNNSSAIVKRHAFYMHQALEKKNLDEALVKASNMISELRTSKLFPSKYYELYIDVTKELHRLTEHLCERYNRLIDKSTEETTEADEWLEGVYEHVQYRTNIVPRLYLLVTVGSVKLKMEKNQHKQIEILYDLVEMTKGVQHPTRGLFLRNYLSSLSREYLPDLEDPTEERNESVKKAIEFVLINFGEMTRLWVRMQHQGAVRDRQRREKERLQLRMLVGQNLRRLSELTSVDQRTYKDAVLPKLVKQIVKGKDKIAQEYLMEIIINVFPDDYHLATLDTFLKTCAKLHSSVNVRSIIEAMMNRLAEYAKENSDHFRKEDVFPKFQQCCQTIINKPKSKMKLEDLLSLQCSLVNFAAQCYPTEDKYVADVVNSVYQLLASKGDKAPMDAVQHVHRAITAPLNALQLRVFDIAEYPKLITFLDFNSQREVARSIAEELIKTGATIGDANQVENLFSLLGPLVKNDSKTEMKEDDEQFELEQEAMATLINRIANDEEPDQHFATLQRTWANHLEGGGDARVKHTAPPVIFNGLSLIQKKYSGDDGDIPKKRKKIFKFVYKVVKLYNKLEPYLGIRVSCQAALAAGKYNLDAISFEFLSNAMILKEEEITDTTQQFDSIMLLAATIQGTKLEDEENHDTLRTKLTRHASQLLKKPLQVQAMLNCLHLFLDTDHTNEVNDIVLKIFKRADKYAGQCMDELETVDLYLQIIQKQIYFLENQGELKIMSTDIISAQIGKAEELLQECTDADMERLGELKSFYRNTKKYCDAKELGIKFGGKGE